MDKPKVYIASGFYGDFKPTIINKLSGSFDLIDPEVAFRRHDIPGVYVGADLNAIASCKLVLAVETDYPRLYGMAAEMGYAVALGTPVIYVSLAMRVNSFLSGLATATFTALEPACGFINDRYRPKDEVTYSASIDELSQSNQQRIRTGGLKLPNRGFPPLGGDIKRPTRIGLEYPTFYSAMRALADEAESSKPLMTNATLLYRMNQLMAEWY